MSEQSRFQIWLEQNKSETNDESLFDFFITFIKMFTSEKKGNKNLIYWVEGHSMDIVSFEFGCFLLHKTDFWLYCKNNKNRQDVMIYLTKMFLTLFSDIFQRTRKKMNALLNNRFQLYEQITKETHFGSDNFSHDAMERYYTCVSDIFLNAKNKNEIVNFTSIKEIPLDLNIDDSFRLKLRLTSFELNLFKSFIEIVECTFPEIVDTPKG